MEQTEKTRRGNQFKNMIGLVNSQPVTGTINIIHHSDHFLRVGTNVGRQRFHTEFNKGGQQEKKTPINYFFGGRVFAIRVLVQHVQPLFVDILTSGMLPKNKRRHAVVTTCDMLASSLARRLHVSERSQTHPRFMSNRECVQKHPQVKLHERRPPCPIPN